MWDTVRWDAAFCGYPINDGKKGGAGRFGTLIARMSNAGNVSRKAIPKAGSMQNGYGGGGRSAAKADEVRSPVFKTRWKMSSNAVSIPYGRSH